VLPSDLSANRAVVAIAAHAIATVDATGKCRHTQTSLTGRRPHSHRGCEEAEKSLKGWRSERDPHLDDTNTARFIAPRLPTGCRAPNWVTMH
jgi:hypothetical protein